MEADLTRFWDHRGPSAGQRECQWIKREMVKRNFNIKSRKKIIYFFHYFHKMTRTYWFLTFYFLCSTDYFQYYQNITNDDIIKLVIYRVE